MNRNQHTYRESLEQAARQFAIAKMWEDKASERAWLESIVFWANSLMGHTHKPWPIQKALGFLDEDEDLCPCGSSLLSPHRVSDHDPDPERS